MPITIVLGQYAGTDLSIRYDVTERVTGMTYAGGWDPPATGPDTAQFSFAVCESDLYVGRRYEANYHVQVQIQPRLGQSISLTGSLHVWPHDACKRVRLKFPTGVAESRKAAKAQTADGKRRPKVSHAAYVRYQGVDSDQDGTACEVRS